VTDGSDARYATGGALRCGLGLHRPPPSHSCLATTMTPPPSYRQAWTLNNYLPLREDAAPRCPTRDGRPSSTGMATSLSDNGHGVVVYAVADSLWVPSQGLAGHALSLPMTIGADGCWRRRAQQPHLAPHHSLGAPPTFTLPGTSPTFLPIPFVTLLLYSSLSGAVQQALAPLGRRGGGRKEQTNVRTHSAPP